MNLRWISLLLALGFAAPAHAQSGLLPANQVWAGPASGGPGYARSRAIVGGDLPAFTGDVTKPAGSAATVVAKFSGNVLPTSAGADSQILLGSGASNFIFGTLPNCPSGVLQYTAATHLFNCGAGGGTLTGVTGSGLAASSGGSPTPNIAVTAAAKTDQQTGTSNVLAVTPLHQQDHDSAAKAWVTFVGTTGAILDSFNVSGVTRSSAGTYVVTFTVPFSTANYASFIVPAGTAAIIGHSGTTTASTAGVTTLSSTFTAVDPTSVSFVAYGTQ